MADPGGVLKLGMTRGFTLLELMVVVSIIAVLVAMAVPQYSMYVYRARATEAAISVETIAYLEQVRILELGEPIACKANPTDVPGAVPKRFELRPDWEDLGLRVDSRVFFQYEVVTSTAGDFIVTAQGDPEGDGTRLKYRLSSTDMKLRRDGGPPP